MGNVLKKSILLAVVGVSMLSAVPAMATGALRVCFAGKPDAKGVFRGYPNYNFEVRVTGTADGSGDGYWLLAMDNSGAAYAQIGGDISQIKGAIDERLKFGVSNISAYPLEYFVIRTDGAYSQDEIRIAAAHAKPFDMSQLRDRLASDPHACMADLNSKTPDTSACACH